MALRDAIDRNPQGFDENQIVVACLKRVKAVDGSYTPEDLSAGKSLSKLANTKAFDGCIADPLNYGTR
ncbi:hypothetical protein SAMN04515692_11728 [Leifsonia sp. CL147]|nr:hypothetical protein SAMN04515694_1232 [Leifsonia sp. CL154]SFL91611.1 hypothetical protein SAMN04515692_11728 [Leifsonia sp. CL147]